MSWSPVGPLRRDALASQGVRFMVIGMASTAVTVLVFNLLVHVGVTPVAADHPLEAYVVAMAAGTAFSFAGNRYWVFAAQKQGHWLRDLVVFVLINVVGTFIPAACLAVSRYAFDRSSVLADNVSANLVGLLLATLFRYWAYKNLAFGGARVQVVATAPRGRRATA